MSALVLIVEDEPAQAEMLRYNLECEGYRTITAADGEEALLLVEERDPDLVILDWMLPLVSGIEVCRRIRARKGGGGLPIIMVTARGEEADRVHGFDTGADDYMVKPFSPGEMVARVRAVLRRSAPGAGEETIACGGVVVNTGTHRVARDGRPLRLSPTEYRLLCALIERPDHVFSRETLLDRVWGRDADLEMRTVDVHIGRLRKALNAAGERDLIRTVRGAGYAIER
ncbi:MAG: phosphate regulon transcriptional regulator PhoB [Alphaproteobacteria bacterium]